MVNINGTETEDCGAVWKSGYMMASEDSEQSEGGGSQPEGVDHELEDAARDEREYVRERLLAELGREPTQSELDEWLRRHTEGY